MSEILRVVGLLGEKFPFSTPLGQTKIFRSLRTFQNNLNYASTSNIPEVIKFYNLGEKTFATDFG